MPRRGTIALRRRFISHYVVGRFQEFEAPRDYLLAWISRLRDAIPLSDGRVGDRRLCRLCPEPSGRYLWRRRFERAGHFAWTNLSNTAHDEITAYSVAFLNHYVKNEPAALTLTERRPRVASFDSSRSLGRLGPVLWRRGASNT
jgi:hypothetical protein